MNQTRILFIGCGNLGSTLLDIWAQHHALEEIVVVQPSLSKKSQYANAKFITFASGVEAIPEDFTPDIIVLAFKPYQMEEVLPQYQRYMNSNTVVISLLAATAFKQLITYCQQAGSVVRVMPNLAMKIGQSVNLICGDKNLSSTQRNEIDRLFALTGEVIWFDDEKMIDLLTPISSSGLAFFFLLAELLTQSSIKLGAEPEQAKVLVRQTLLGSAMFAAQSPELDFDQLVSKVASKKGVTEAGLQVFRPELTELVDRVIMIMLERIEQLKQ